MICLKLSGDFHFNNYGLQMDTMLQVQKKWIIMVVIVSTCAMCLTNEGIICRELNGMEVH